MTYEQEYRQARRAIGAFVAGVADDWNDMLDVDGAFWRLVAAECARAVQSGCEGGWGGTLR